MNIYHRINSYLLERFTSLWNTRFVWMILIGLCIHGLFFLFGYLHLDYEILKAYSVREHFFRVHYFSLYLIFCLIAAIYFSFKYYTHNPFRNFYPVSKIYFWKVFAQLFVIPLLYTTVSVSFENGMRSKLKKIISFPELSKEIKNVNLAYPFLYSDIGSYHIENRSYPEPFPLDEISDFIVGHDSINDIDIRHGIDAAKPYVGFGVNQYQFGRKVQKEIDSCHTEEVLGDIVDVSKVYGLEEYSLYNFSSIYIPHYEDIHLSGKHNYPHQGSADEYNTIAPLIHKWQSTKDTKAIEHVLSELERICEKYAISHRLNASKMARAGLEQNLNVKQLVSTGLYDAVSYKYNEVAAAEAAEEATTTSRVRKRNADYNYFADISAFSNLVRNTNTLYTRMGTNQFFNEFIWIWIFISFGISCLLVITKYVHFKEIAIGIVITGILTAFYAMVYFTGFSENDVLSLSVLSAVYLVIIIATGMIMIWGKQVGKSFILKWFIPMSASIMLLLPLLYVAVHEATRYEYQAPCNDYTTTKYSFEVMPFHFLVMELAALHLIFILLRKIHARAS